MTRKWFLGLGGAFGAGIWLGLYFGREAVIQGLKQGDIQLSSKALEEMQPKAALAQTVRGLPPVMRGRGHYRQMREARDLSETS